MKSAKNLMIITMAAGLALSTAAYAADSTTESPSATPSMPMMEGQGKPMMGHQPGGMGSGKCGGGRMMNNPQAGMPMMGGGMMNPQQMQQMMTMRQQHMKTMEDRLANIEALLQQLVDLQKAK